MTQILLPDQLLALGLILEIAAMRHGDGQRQSAPTPRTAVRVEANGQLGLRGHPAAQERIGAAETFTRHVSDRAIGLPQAFQRHPFADAVDGHQAQQSDLDAGHTVRRIGREVEGA